MIATPKDVYLRQFRVAKRKRSGWGERGLRREGVGNSESAGDRILSAGCPGRSSGATGDQKGAAECRIGLSLRWCSYTLLTSPSFVS